MGYSPIEDSDEALGKRVLDAAFMVHSKLGPGLLESVYERCLKLELQRANVPAASQVILPINYGGEVIESGLRLDLWVGKRVVVELKAVESLLPIHEAQLFTYLKLTGCRLGFLLNFNVEHMKEGIRRVVR
ncbi:MAG: GxxExxY protein [Planctomycetota bacterium]